ncbi:alpha-glucosidase [Maribius pontilimi]|uniref:Alpha-glucosidase n=1 Tax=Palleronia pontilimi TaxID=1964209 RepID=A0A934IFP5_9RHOB|nr:alpha-glucosidase [Palleronia pontilimi]MBJ3762595.1 alpha-glucosidase [Palleronia pontilimi]
MTATLSDLPWWKRATGYQIYPRSFMDSDGDGVGDIPGIVSRLDHLADLGVGFIWLSPVYASPQRDNGYDISDYRAIHSEYGTLDEFDRLVAEARDRGIGIVMDLVVNHSSSDHAWFQAAAASRDAPEHDYYVWRQGRPGGLPPTDRQAIFGGPAWTYVGAVDAWYLHLFSPGQPDLNWDNPALRAEIWDMMRWWIDRGIAGFRMDVIDLIGKDVDAGHFDEGPHVWDRLDEMHAQVLAGRDLLTVGESWAVSRETVGNYIGKPGPLAMMFHFDHVKLGWDDTFHKFRPREVTPLMLKREIIAWQTHLRDDGWDALFLSNHDLPRQVSRYGDDGADRVASAKALATMLHLLRGTPFIYQGEEIGMTNFHAASLSDVADLEVHGQYDGMMAAGLDHATFMDGVNLNGRDHARTPMQWDASASAGFTDGVPWMTPNPNYPGLNVARDRADPDGLFAHYRALTQLRRAHPLIVEGGFQAHLEDHPAVFAFTRGHREKRLSVLVNLTGQPQSLTVPDAMCGAGKPLVCTHDTRHGLQGDVRLAPWEAVALLRG